MSVLLKAVGTVTFTRTRTCADGVDVSVEGRGAGYAVTNHGPACCTDWVVLDLGVVFWLWMSRADLMMLLTEAG